MDKSCNSPISDEDKSIVSRFDEDYVPGVTILARAFPAPFQSKRVRVYVDGILTTMNEGTLKLLIENGFFRVVSHRS